MINAMFVRITFLLRSTKHERMAQTSVLLEPYPRTSRFRLMVQRYKISVKLIHSVAMVCDLSPCFKSTLKLQIRDQTCTRLLL